MDDKKNKKYKKPEAEVVEFNNEDIIVTSVNWGDEGYDNNESWGN